MKHEIINDRKIKLGRILFWLSFLHYYTLVSGFLAYLAVFRFKFKKVKPIEFFVILSLLFLFVCQMLGGKAIIATIIDIRFYWGWLLFYFLFKNITISLKFTTIGLVILCIITIFETLLINTFVAPTSLPNFPDAEAGIAEYGRSYQRPYSFGASATVGSSLIVVLVALTKVNGWRLWLSIFTTFIYASGTGILSLGLLFIIRYLKLIFKIIIPFTILFFIFQNLFQEVLDLIIGELQRKVGFEYIRFIFWLKLNAMLEGFAALDSYELFFGDPEGGRGGDFGALLFYAV